MSQPALDLRVDKEKKMVFIDREFNAPPALVWDAFTKAELLDRWVAPKPLTAKTKYMDFTVGGRRFYAMVFPDGTMRWSVQEYLAITPTTHFKMYNTFADENENRELPGSEWDYHFTDLGGRTKVSIAIFNESLERMERMIEMGFAQGFAMSVENLEDLLAEISGRD